MSERDRRAVRALYDAWFGAMESGDVEAFLPLLAEDVILKGPGSPAVEGRAAVEEGLREFHAAFTEEVDFVVEELEVSGDLAWARVREEVTLRPREGGRARTLSGTHLGILRRGSDGSWRVARDVSSLDAFPQG